MSPGPNDPAARRDALDPVPPHDSDDEREDLRRDLQDLGDYLFAYARRALRVAEHLTPDIEARMGHEAITPHAGEALAYVRAAREALQARQLADEPPPTGELEAAAHVVACLRAAHAGVERQRDDLARALGEVEAELALTDKAAIAASIRRRLDAVLRPGEADEPEADEPSGDI